MRAVVAFVDHSVLKEEDVVMIKAAIATVALATAGAACWFHGSAICHAFMAALHR